MLMCILKISAMTIFSKNLYREVQRSLQVLLFLSPSFSDKVRSNLSSFKIFSRKESSFVPKRVLVLTKISRYQFEKMREPDLDESLLRLKLKERGSDYEAMLTSHYRNKAAELRTTEVLRNLNIEYKIMDRLSIDSSSVAWADLILPVGGDGTFLLASNLITDNKKPIMGINSDPESSEGFLLLPAKYTEDIPEIFRKLKDGEYKFAMRRRIRITLKGDNIWGPPSHLHEKCRTSSNQRLYFEKEEDMVDTTQELPEERRIPWLALNEVFIGEILSARTSSLLVKLDDEEQYHKIKSSGLCVSTGTGSTSWFRSISCLSPQTVKEVLSFAEPQKIYLNEEVEKICSEYNNRLQFSEEDGRMNYAIRDMIVSETWPLPKSMHPRGFCMKVMVRSLCHDSALVIDGGISIPFPMGTIAILETYPEDSLRNVVLE
ncbi:NAD kinase 2, mitochondrial isoform X1 [Leptopilina boulardi]|uniref:NAD kinase 2, mitochondrial isoform X1 n=1 Tax=Leptopilina boulardi TaxID=63433 RepID=UPI0021F583C4|nr:NAD kinase 2, mitochondrial isoform X1 [Leptopilina boulardi]